MMTSDPLALLRYRVDQLRQDVDRTDRWREATAQRNAAREVEYATLKDDVAALRDDVRGLRRVLIGLTCSIAGSAIIFGLTVLAATGKL